MSGMIIDNVVGDVAVGAVALGACAVETTDRFASFSVTFNAKASGPVAVSAVALVAVAEGIVALGYGGCFKSKTCCCWCCCYVYHWCG